MVQSKLRSGSGSETQGWGSGCISVQAAKRAVSPRCRVGGATSKLTSIEPPPPPWPSVTPREVVELSLISLMFPSVSRTCSVISWFPVEKSIEDISKLISKKSEPSAITSSMEDRQ